MSSMPESPHTDGHPSPNLQDWKKGPPLLFIADLGAAWLEYARAQLHWFCKSICLSLPQLNARKCASRISLTRHFDGNESLAEMD